MKLEEHNSMKEIVTYTTKEDRIPFDEWFRKLDCHAANKIRTALARIETGNMGDVRPVGQGVSERRIDFGQGYRVYFGQDGNKVVLLCGGTKKRQSSDIERAKAQWDDYKARRQKGDQHATDKRIQGDGDGPRRVRP